MNFFEVEYTLKLKAMVCTEEESVESIEKELIDLVQNSYSECLIVDHIKEKDITFISSRKLRSHSFSVGEQVRIKETKEKATIVSYWNYVGEAPNEEPSYRLKKEDNSHLEATESELEKI